MVQHWSRVCKRVYFVPGFFEYLLMICAGVYHIWVLLEGIVPVVSTLLLQISMLWKTSQ